MRLDRVLKQSVVGVAFALSPATSLGQSPLSTTFTYQGQLKISSLPANDVCDMQFRLFDAATFGSQVGGTVCQDNVTPAEGLFTVSLDFGAAAFDGNARWLEVAIRADTTPANCTGGAYTTLTTRQPITAVPYSLQTRGIFVDAVGNVGIGTTNPTSTFDVLRATAGSAAHFGNTLEAIPKPDTWDVCTIPHVNLL
jgi:hypothetical protein